MKNTKKNYKIILVDFEVEDILLSAVPSVQET